MPALLIFAKEPEPGRVKTRLAAALGFEAACRLYRAFLADLAAAFRGFEVPVAWWVDGDPAALRALGTAGATFRRQPPGDLGVRLDAAFGWAFSRWPGPVAVIGTDCPILGPAHVRTLLHAVSPGPNGGDAAILPAEDGGYVGLALASPAPEAFADVPWSTERVTEVTAANLRRAGRKVVLLQTFYDVDEFADVERLAGDLSTTPGVAPATAAALKEIEMDASATRPEQLPWR